jgi:UDP-3-O-[3-hydroxymyristoyl] glucosamine N-acyltransferase
VDNNGLARGRGTSRLKHWYPSVWQRALTALPPNCTSKPTHMGACVYIYFGVRIGQEGFGFTSTTDRFLSVPRRGLVVLEDDVEVRANAMFDRESSRDTAIDAGCRLNNLVQIRKCYPQPKLRHHRTGGRVQPYLKISSAGQAAIAGHLRSGQGAEIGGRRATFRMWFQARRCLAALLTKKRLLPTSCLAQKMAKGEG